MGAARGARLVRDLRVRWAPEEAGIPYDIWLIGLEDKDTSGYRALQPFGRVPAMNDGDLTLFESGSILLPGNLRSAPSAKGFERR